MRMKGQTAKRKEGLMVKYTSTYLYDGNVKLIAIFEDSNVVKRKEKSIVEIDKVLSKPKICGQPRTDIPADSVRKRKQKKYENISRYSSFS